jgi:hypothetical protein
MDLATARVLQELDFRSRRDDPIGPGRDNIDSLANMLNDNIAAIIYFICVITSATGHRIRARSADKDIIAVDPVQNIIFT